MKYALILMGRSLFTFLDTRFYYDKFIMLLVFSRFIVFFILKGNVYLLKKVGDLTSPTKVDE